MLDGFVFPAGMETIQGSSPVFRIPEVLLLVFEDLDKPSLTSCARVCRLWNAITQEVLWRHIPSLLPIFMLVGNMDTVRGSRDRFNTWSEYNDPLSVNWNRLRSFARCVHSIRHSEGPWRDFEVGSLSLGDLATLLSGLSGGTQYAFPHLRDLVWEAAYHPTSLLQILFIVGPSLKVLDLTTLRGNIDIEVEELCKLFAALRFRQDIQLQEFRLRTEDTVGFENPLYSFLRTQRTLRFLRMDVFDLRAFVESTSPALEESLVDLQLAVWEDDEEEDCTCLLKFQALESVELDLPFPKQIARCMIERFGTCWPNLKRWRSPVLYGGPADLMEMAAQLPSLEDLQFGLILDDPMPPTGQPIPRLARLRRLDAILGWDPDDGNIDSTDVDVPALARLLTTICPDSTKIDWRTRPDYSTYNQLNWKPMEAEIDQIRRQRVTGPEDRQDV